MAEDIGNIGGLLTPREDYVPNIQSVYGDIIQNAPDYQYFTAPLSNLGNTTATYGGQNNIVVAPNTPIRVVNNATGEVIYSGVGYEGAQAAIDAASALSASAGNKANWDIQVAGPTMQGFESVSTDRPNSRTLGLLADIALPIAGSFLPGVGNVIGAAIGSGVSSVAQGRSLEDTLLRAGLAAGGSYVGNQLFGPVSQAGNVVAQTPSLAGDALANLPSLLDEIAATAAQNLASAGLGSVVPAAVSGLSGDIIATAIREASPSLIPSVVSGAVGAVPSFFDAAQINNVATVDQTTQPTQPDEIVVTGQVPTATTPSPTIPGILPPTTTTNVPPPNPAEDIVATAQTQTRPVTPTPVVLPPATTTPNVPASDPTEDIRVTAPRDTQVVTPPAIPPVFLPPTTTPPATTPTDTTPPAKNDDFLGTGLSLTQLAAITGLGTSLLSSLLGGGGTGTTPTTPYVSPFGGLGGGLGGGMDFRTTPAIADYERYGFGPEATFFRPEYNRLVGTGASLIPSYAQNMQQQPQTANIGQPQIYAASSQPVADRSAYLNNLFRQIDTQVSQGLLAGSQAQDIQKELRKTYINPQSTTEQLQNVYNTQIQQYLPLI